MNFPSVSGQQNASIIATLSQFKMLLRKNEEAQSFVKYMEIGFDWDSDNDYPGKLNVKYFYNYNSYII